MSTTLPKALGSAPEGGAADIAGHVVIDLHAWCLDVDERERIALARHLEPDELARASRYIFERDRNRFIVGRARLREILASYVGLSPGELRFDHGEHGKPRLSSSAPTPHFNLSHAQDLAALAVSWSVEVGADIERVRPVESGVAERFFSPREVVALTALPQSQWLRAFFRCWTRKEAVIKALGVGLSLDLAAFDVSLAPEAPPALLRFDGDPDASTRWSILDASPATDVIIAVAALTEGQQVVLRQLSHANGISGRADG